MTLARSLVLAALGAAAADQVCSNMDAGCAAAETEDMGMLQKVSMMARIEKHEFQKNVSGPIPECQNLSTNASNASKCPTGTIVNSGLWCISNPSCPGITGCVEGTGCQYVPAPAPALLQQSGPIPECQNLSTNASNASKCPTGTIVNSGLWCISNPSCPGITGCVEGTGCQYVDAPNSSLLQTTSIDDVWEQLKGAVNIDQLTEAAKEATGALKEALQDKAEALKEVFPEWEDIEEKFKDKWSEITAAVDFQELQSMVEEAKAKHKENYEELAGKLSELQAKVNLDDIKASAQDFWEQHKDSLPDLDDLKKHVTDLGDKAKGAISDAWDSLTDGDRVKDLVEDLQGRAQDAFGKAKDAFGDAKDAVSGWFR